MHISQYKNIIESLKKEIDQLRDKLKEKELPTFINYNNNQLMEQ